MAVQKLQQQERSIQHGGVSFGIYRNRQKQRDLGFEQSANKLVWHSCMNGK